MNQLEANPNSFRRLLQQELMKRVERNPRYSLRAFAQQLELSHASLSHIMAGRRPLTRKMIQKLGLSLGLTNQQIAKFTDETTLKTKDQGSRPQRYQEITLDTFVTISEWYHDAILELTRIKGFRPDPKWIAQTLGVTRSEVNMAIERLQKLELLEITREGKWLDLSRDNTTPLDPNFTALALKKYQRKILEISLQALAVVPKLEREHLSNMMAIQKSDLEEVRKRIHKFRFSLSKFLQRKEAKPDEVYQLAISFFPLTKRSQ